MAEESPKPRIIIESAAPDEFTSADYDGALHIVSEYMDLTSSHLESNWTPRDVLESYRILCIAGGELIHTSSQYHDPDVKDKRLEADKHVKDLLDTPKEDIHPEIVDELETAVKKSQDIEEQSVITKLHYFWKHTVRKNDIEYSINAGKNGYVQIVIRPENTQMTGWDIKYWGDTPYKTHGKEFFINASSWNTQRGEYNTYTEFDFNAMQNDVFAAIQDFTRVVFPTFPPHIPDRKMNTFSDFSE